MEIMRAFVVGLGVLAACGRAGDRAESFLASAPVAEHAKRPTAGAAKFRVMTYNVNFGVAGDPAGLDAVEHGKPDLVFLQETNAEWEAAFVGRFATSHPHHRFSPPKNEWVAGGMGVMSRWPIVTVDQLDTEHGPFFAWRVVVDAPGGRLLVLNVHLRPPMSESGSWVVGYFSTRAVREAEMIDHLAALDRLGPDLPTLAVGDFNEEDEGMAIAKLVARGFSNALPRFQPDVDTWQWPVGDVTLKFRLDHVLHDRHFRALDANIVDEGRSDHAPVWADLERVTR
jgi:endonuclease/exonuclease/phosphatase family metal-dependent hydrolase